MPCLTSVYEIAGYCLMFVFYSLMWVTIIVIILFRDEDSARIDPEAEG